MAYNYNSLPERDRLTKIIGDFHCEEFGLNTADWDFDEENLIKIVYERKRPNGSAVRYLLGLIEHKDPYSEVRAFKIKAQSSFAAPVTIENDNVNCWAYKVAASFDWLNGTDEEIEEGIAAVRKELKASVELINEVETVVDEAMDKLIKIMHRGENN